MSGFSHIIGNDHIKQYLTNMLNKEHLPHGILFSGPDGIGKSLFAKAVASLLFEDSKRVASGNHPDLHEYRPEGKIGMHSIASLRNFIEEVYLQPYEAKRKIFIIHDAERMLSTSANALLKTLEEPSPDSVIILLTSQQSWLKETILSRCFMVHFHPLQQQELAQLLITIRQCSQEDAQWIAIQAKGSVAKALEIYDHGGSSIRTVLLEGLAQGYLNNYPLLLQLVKKVHDAIEKAQQESVEQIKEMQQHRFNDEMTAIQKHALQKELEGAGTLKVQEEADTVFEVIAGWYRDMHLQSVNGDHKLLVHPDYAQASQQAVQQGVLIPLEKVIEALHAAKLALTRSTSLSICLENLFLRLT